MAKLADARDLKSRGTNLPYRFDPGFRHQYIAEWSSPVARRAHNPKVMWFKSHLRNQTKQEASKRVPLVLLICRLNFSIVLSGYRQTSVARFVSEAEKP